MRQSQRILAVVNDRGLYDRVAQPLSRSSIEVNRVPSGAGALILVGNLRYDLILVEAPLPDLDLSQFVAAVRTIDSPCASSSVIVLSQTTATSDLSDSQLDDDVMVIGADGEAAELHAAISNALGVAVRATSRLLVQVEASLDEGPFQRVGQSANVSETGLLLTGTPSLPVGSEVRLTLELPGDPRPLPLTGEVVRETVPEREDVSGTGVRFIDVPTESAERLRDFVEAQRAHEADAGERAAETDLDEPADSVGRGA